MTLPKPEAWDRLNIGGCFSWEGEAEFLNDVIQITKPRDILEIGFFAGSSAFMWLQLSAAKVTSVDPMVCLYDPKEVHTGRPENVQKLKDHFGAERFHFIQKDSKLIRPDVASKRYDLLFMDGGHWPTDVRNDFNLALELGIPWVLADDFVTDVEKVYYTEFENRFDMVRLYPRPARFQGRTIPIALLKRK